MKRMNSTRFISQEELAKDFTEIALNEKRCTTGGIPFLVQGGKAFVDGSDTHTIVFGATGSRKTRMFAMPLTEILGRAGESFVVTDPKGEIHQKTAAHMRSLGMRTECINLRDLRAGSAWNPLLLPYEYYHGDKRTKALQLLDSLVTAMTEEKLQSDAYWAYTAGDVITGLILLLFETALPEECHMKSLLRLWMEYISNREGFLEYVKSHYGETMVYQKLSGLDNASERTVGSIESIVAMGLNRLVIDEELTLFLSQPESRLSSLWRSRLLFT